MSLTRRDFMRNAAGVTVAGMAGFSAMAKEAGGKSAAKSKVILIRNADVMDGEGKVNAEIMQRMLDEAVMRMTDKGDAVEAWKSLVKPDDVVGIKSNVWQYLRTPVELEAAIERRVMDAGVPEGKVGLEDYKVLENPLFQQATALINVRPMRTHHWAGVGSCIKNYIVFSDKPFTWHADACANLAGVWDLPPCKGKTRLNILVMMTPLFNGKGPHHYNKRYVWPYKGLIVGTDPVAVDATGLRIIEAKRREHFKGDQPFTVPPHHIRIAEEKYHLGVADPARIEVVKLGWDEGILV